MENGDGRGLVGGSPRKKDVNFSGVSKPMLGLGDRKGPGGGVQGSRGELEKTPVTSKFDGTGSVVRKRLVDTTSLKWRAPRRWKETGGHC